MNKSYLVVNFWDVKTRGPQTLLVGGDKMKIQMFINRNKRETTINDATQRVAGNSKKGCAGVFLLPIGLALVYYLLS